MFEPKMDAVGLNLTIKEWYIIYENLQKGPYSIQELKVDPRFTPDTLVWKKGFKEWTPARLIPELNQAFKDDPESRPLHPKPTNVEQDLGQDQATLAMQQDPYQLYLWLLLFLIILFYTLYQQFK